MNEDRLLERIRSWKADPTRRGRADARKQIDSVVRHLKQILNTRQGNVPIAEDYGIPDLTTFMQNYPDSVNEIEKSIRQAIATYEPRLNSVNVIFIYQEDDILCLRFQITAQLSDEKGKNIRIETIVDSDGKISLKY
jgi:type VI secretion system protein